ncbi:MAG: hypothetical protein ACREB6_07450, partial [Rhodospirillales bacterium]
VTTAHKTGHAVAPRSPERSLLPPHPGQSPPIDTSVHKKSAQPASGATAPVTGMAWGAMKAATRNAMARKILARTMTDASTEIPIVESATAIASIPPPAQRHRIGQAT